MKGVKKKKHFMRFIIILILILILASLLTLVIYNRDVLTELLGIKKVTNEFKLPFEEKEYKNIAGYDFYTKNNGTVIVKSGYDVSNVSKDGTTVNVHENVVKIEQYTGEGNGIAPKVMFLTENGNLYSLDLGQDTLDDSNLYKYNFDQKIKDIKEINVQNIWHNIATVAILENDETRIIGPHNILLSPENYSLGKSVTMLSLNGSYIVNENDGRVRIGNINTDKYFSIPNEEWVNSNADTSKYVYLKNDSNIEIKAKDIKLLVNNDITYIYIITTDKKLIYLSISDASLLTESKVIEKYEIKLNKDSDSFILSGSDSTVRIKFTDGTYADIKNNNLIFGMLSNNNKFFAFAKQDLKNNIDYKILNDKLGLNYKIKDYAILDSTDSINNTFIISIFMITDDNKIIMTRTSNNQIEDDISKMKIEEIKTDKAIDKFEQIFSEDDGYTTNVVFKDGSKIDLKTFAKDYLSVS